MVFLEALIFVYSSLSLDDKGFLRRDECSQGFLGLGMSEKHCKRSNRMKLTLEGKETRAERGTLHYFFSRVLASGFHKKQQTSGQLAQVVGRSHHIRPTLRRTEMS